MSLGTDQPFVADGLAHSPEQKWQPELRDPALAVYGWEDLQLGGLPYGETLETYLHRIATSIADEVTDRVETIEFPATHPTTKISEDERDTTYYRMRYVPHLFDDIQSPELAMLADRYRQVLAFAIQNELDLPSRPQSLPEGQRNAEAFVVKAGSEESLDPHADERITAVFYPLPGQGLVVSHCVNARTIDDIRDNPVTLVLPGAASFVIFDGTQHPHIGLDLGIAQDDPDEVKIRKAASIHESFKIAKVVSNLTEEVIFEGRRRSFINPEYLASLPRFGGDRIAISMNFNRNGDPVDVEPTSLDHVFDDILTSEPDEPRA